MCIAPVAWHQQGVRAIGPTLLPGIWRNLSHPKAGGIVNNWPPEKQKTNARTLGKVLGMRANFIQIRNCDSEKKAHGCSYGSSQSWKCCSLIFCSYVCLPVCPYVRRSVDPSICLSVGRSICLVMHPCKCAWYRFHAFICTWFSRTGKKYLKSLSVRW